MSRNFFPAALAIGLGVYTSYYTFQPALRQIQHEKDELLGSQTASQPQASASTPASSANDSNLGGTAAPVKENGDTGNKK